MPKSKCSETNSSHYIVYRTYANQTKKVGGTLSAGSNAVVGISAQQEDDLHTVTSFSISRDVATFPKSLIN